VRHAKPKKQPPAQIQTPDRPTYGGAELRPFSGRSGAMDAYKLPSLRGGQLVAPRLYMTDYESK